MSISLLTRRTRQAGARDSEIDGLRAENNRLRQLLAQRASIGATQSGYLFKYRPQATSSLWANTWENRYFIIQDATLAYFKSEQDIHLPPRGKIELLDTYVAYEGLKRNRFHTFNIQDKSGLVLIRLSTERESDMNTWIQALEAAGCSTRGDGDDSSRGRNGRSPSPSTRSSPGNSAASDGRQSSPDRSGIEVDSQQSFHSQQQQSVLTRKNSGYTSDASDVGGRVPARFASRKGHRSDDKDRGCAIVHLQPKYSILSKERINFLDQTGFITLLIIIVAATNFRLILENMIKYGLLFNPFSFIKAALTPSGSPESGLLVLCWPLMALNCVFALGIERLAAGWLGITSPKKQSRVSSSAAASHRHRMSGSLQQRTQSQRRAIQSFIFFLNFVNIFTELLLPCVVIYYTEAEPLPAGALTMVCIVLWMKLISFAHVNADIRNAHANGKYRPGERSSRELPQGVEHAYNYPENLTLNNMSYFLIAPTLCYQLSYPRSPRFRLRWMLKKIVMFGCALGMMLFIMEQYIEPTIDNSLKPLREMDWLRVFERVLKLSIPTLYFWLAMFYTLFDLWLNILAEFTRFGDREFYKDWWNATTVGEYWRLWNMPVHKWMLRHVYYPCIGVGIPKFWAGFIVFFISAVFHELLVGVPLHMLKAWAFIGIMMQVPLMWVTELLKQKFKSERIGNAIFWISFCFLGQPLAEIMYYHDYRKVHG